MLTLLREAIDFTIFCEELAKIEKLAVSDQKSEVRSQKSEIRNQKSEVRSQMRQMNMDTPVDKGAISYKS